MDDVYGGWLFGKFFHSSQSGRCSLLARSTCGSATTNGLAGRSCHHFGPGVTFLMTTCFDLPVGIRTTLLVKSKKKTQLIDPSAHQGHQQPTRNGADPEPRRLSAAATTMQRRRSGRDSLRAPGSKQEQEMSLSGSHAVNSQRHIRVGLPLRSRQSRANYEYKYLYWSPASSLIRLAWT